MRGMPKRLNTPQDVQNCLQLFPEETKRMLKVLYENRFKLVQEKVLSDKDVVPEDNTHEVVTMEIDGVEKRVLMKKVDDTTSQIFKLGLTKTQIESLIAEIEEEEVSR